MSVFLGAVKSSKFVPAFVFNVYDYDGYDKGERPKFVKRETVRRSNQNSAIDFIMNKWSLQKTNHHYYVELLGTYYNEKQKKDFLKRHK